MDGIDLGVFDPANIGRWMITSGLQIAIILLVAIVAYLILTIATRHLKNRIQELDDEQGSHLDRRTETISRLVKTTGIVLIISVSMLMILDQLGINIGPILASVGVASLALGLGAQTLVKDVIGGLFLILEDQYHIGDVIEFDGSVGTVEDMTLRVTSVRDVQGYIHYVPNGEIRILVNRSRDWARAIIDIGISYDDDVDLALQVLDEIGKSAIQDSEIGLLMLDAPMVTGIEGLEDWKVRLRISVKTEAGEQWGVQRYLRNRIRQEFPARGLSLAYPRQEVVLVQNE
jgi:small-conductance mechanosensitive channel